MNRACFIVCWFGQLPCYVPIWFKSCTSNSNFDFLLITDDDTEYTLPDNVIRIMFTCEEFTKRVDERVIANPSIKAPYRLCDFRPMYGIIFNEELQQYSYWGYCDVDVVFGNINKFLSYEELFKYDAMFNGGHFSLIKNSESMNYLYQQKGSIFSYKTVATRDATFAFDETTGIQRIARASNINAQFGIPYIETESKYNQLRSRMDRVNPDYQAYYWENGNLFRVKSENGRVYYQEIAYIHLQKRKLELLDESVVSSDSFWITPSGYVTKCYKGIPTIQDINTYNPYYGEEKMRRQAADYKKRKILEIIKRTPFQIYVRLKQQRAGINAADGTRDELGWMC